MGPWLAGRGGNGGFEMASRGRPRRYCGIDSDLDQAIRSEVAPLPESRVCPPLSPGLSDKLAYYQHKGPPGAAAELLAWYRVVCGAVWWPGVRRCRSAELKIRGSAAP